MKAEELRMGNKILNPYNEVTEVDCEIMLFISRQNMNHRKVSDYYNPIPLTEEWLLKAGFKKFGNDYSLGRIIVHSRRRGYVIRRTIPIMNYVHTLQNYIYALTGEELKFEL